MLLTCVQPVVQCDVARCSAVHLPTDVKQDIPIPVPISDYINIVAVSARGDVSSFFNTQMVLDLNGEC